MVIRNRASLRWFGAVNAVMTSMETSSSAPAGTEVMTPPRNDRMMRGAAPGSWTLMPASRVQPQAAWAFRIFSGPLPLLRKRATQVSRSP